MYKGSCTSQVQLEGGISTLCHCVQKIWAVKHTLTDCDNQPRHPMGLVVTMLFQWGSTGTENTYIFLRIM